MVNPTGKHRRKRRHHGEGTVILRRDHWRARPWAAVVPYLDESGRRREMWLSAASRDEAEELRKAEVARIGRGLIPTAETVGEYVDTWLSTIEVGPGTWPSYHAHVTARIAPTLGRVPLGDLRPAMVRAAMSASPRRTPSPSETTHEIRFRGPSVRDPRGYGMPDRRLPAGAQPSAAAVSRPAWL